MRSEIKVLPEKFLERLRKIFAPQQFDTIANTFARELPTTFRANFLKINSPSELQAKIAVQGFHLEKVSWAPGAFILKQGRLRELQETAQYQNGEIYVQALSSLVPVLILDPQPGEIILDLTAAPGSKTTQMASRMRGEGSIVACDNNRVRFFKLKANLQLQGCENIEALLTYGESIGRKYANYFDRVLLDAPCSSEGRFNVHKPQTIGYWKMQKVKEMQKKQKKLFFSAVSALKPGGTLVYSTCTFAPEENEGVLDWAFKKFGGGIEIETIKLPFPNQMLGLASWEGEAFHPQVRKSARIIPNQFMEGFFCCQG